MTGIAAEYNNDFQPCKFLTDVVLAKGMSVLTAKKIIVKELRKRGLLDVPLDRYKSSILR